MASIHVHAKNIQVVWVMFLLFLSFYVFYHFQASFSLSFILVLTMILIELQFQ